MSAPGPFNALRKFIPGPRWGVVVIPYLWMLVFFAIPFLIVLKISFARLAIAMPPYTPILEVDGSEVALKLNLSNFLQLGALQNGYLAAYWSSLEIAAIATLLTLLVGYPMAYVIARLPPSSRNIAMMLVVLPSWTSFLIRVYAWIGILKSSGPVGRLLEKTGVIDVLQSLGWIEGRQILYTPLALHRHRLLLPAVHGAAAVHQPGQA